MIDLMSRIIQKFNNQKLNLIKEIIGNNESINILLRIIEASINIKELILILQIINPRILKIQEVTLSLDQKLAPLNQIDITDSR